MSNPQPPPPGSMPPDPYRPVPTPSAPAGGNYRNGWVVALLAFLVGLLIGGGVIALVQGGGDNAEPTASRTTVTVTEPADEDPSSVDEPATSAAPDEPTPTTETEGENPGTHALGEGAPVGDSYTVAVVGVEKNANQTIEAANSFNDPPKGQYVLVDLRATYVGNEVGTPWIDLTIRFAGTDARQYADYECGAVVPRSGTSVPDLSHGGKVTFQICFDVPPKAIDGGQVIVEDGFSFDDSSREFWAID